MATSSYDAANRVRAFGAREMVFDANGSLESMIDPDGTTHFTWDARGRLVAVEGLGTLATFDYAHGRRTARTVNAQTTQFVYDGGDVSAQVEAGRVTTYLRSLATDEMLGGANPDSRFFSLYDALGSAFAVIDDSGALTAAYAFEPFGATTIAGQDFGNSFQFAGRENDRVAGLYYYRARYYHPGLQRFISEDPIGHLGGDPNLYSYVFNNPTRFRDPLGLCVTSDPADCFPPSTGAAPTSGRKDDVSEPAPNSSAPPIILAGVNPLLPEVGLSDWCKKAGKYIEKRGLAILIYAACVYFGATPKGPKMPPDIPKPPVPTVPQKPKPQKGPPPGGPPPAGPDPPP